VLAQLFFRLSPRKAPARYQDIANCEHSMTCLMTRNIANRLKTLKGLTSCEYICQQRQQPEQFICDPVYHILGLYP
jgi:hypothetical protein